METRYSTYEDFWPYYVSEHRNPTCRWMHFVGTNLTLASLVAAAAHSPWWLACAPVLGYGFAWVGHFVFEKNRPATFRYPAWSLRGDFRMFRLMWTGRMSGEIARLSPSGPRVS